MSSAAADTSDDVVTNWRLAALELRWEPIPITNPDYAHPKVKSPGKQPWFRDWQSVPVTATLIHQWAAWQEHRNTGVRTGHVLGLDLDVPDSALMVQVDAVADQHLGATPLVRVGKPPKALRCYRNQTPIGKLETPELFLPNGTKLQIEAMGAGQQVVAYGTHPDTKLPYTWLGGSPADTSADDLPVVTKDQIAAFLAAAEALFRQAGARTKAEIEAAAEKAASEEKPRPNGKTGDFFKSVNAAALADLQVWVSRVFGDKAKLQKTGAYRVSSADLGRNYEEDLSIHPDGIRDFGPEKNLTPIDVVMEFGGAPSPQAAAHTLCEWLGRKPGAFGWEDRPQQNPEEPPEARWRDEAPEAEPAGEDAAEAAAKTEDRPVIPVIPGLRHQAADAGIAALRGGHIYQRGPALVRCATVQAKNSHAETVHTPGIVNITQPYLERELGRAAGWNRPTKTGKKRIVDPPHDVAAQIISMQGLWPFPVLRGVIGTPTLRPDGTLLLVEGYDELTGYYLLAPPIMPAIPDEPGKDDARKALAELKELIVEFPFVGQPSRSVGLSCLMTPVLRAAMPVAPCHAATAPEAGTGKSYLFDTAAMVATGDLCPVVSMSKGSAEEREKRLIGCALSGHPIISLDNLTVALEGDFLCQLSERPRLLPRPLGTSEMTAIPNSFTVFANGHNLVVAADMAARRTIVAELDANVEDTTKRTFQSPSPTQKIAANRGKYVAAALTMARAYVVAGCPDVLTLPSYDAWSRYVRSPLIWLGEADPIDTMGTARDDDPLRSERIRVFAAWTATLGCTNAHGWRTAELIKAALTSSPSEFRDALIEIAPAQRPGGSPIDADRLGYWLRGTKGAIAGGYKLTSNTADRSRPRWVLTRSTGR
jgi:putative DNA primase/helicase